MVPYWLVLLWGWFVLVVGMVPVSWAAGFDDFISPISNPVNFEDPRATTEVRPIFAYHTISDNFVSSGGNAKVAALQLRLAITERLAIIATKDGYVWLEPDDVLPRKNGWANIGFGLKYGFYYDPANRLMLTGGLRYETGSGDKDVFQGRGDGVMNGFLSGAFGYKDLHLIGYTGPRIPISGNDSTFWDTSLHVDYQIGRFYPLIEFNWVQCLDGGRRLPLDQEGFDFFNLGSRDAGGHGVVTQAFGVRYRITDDLSIPTAGDRVGGIDVGFAFETPLTDREDIFGWRTTTDVIVWLR